MKRALSLFALSFALAACPGRGVTITGTIADVRGQCHHIVGDDGRRYAVKAGALGDIRPERRVRISGELVVPGDCAGATLIKPNKVSPL